jgi:hypothetical protein
LADKIEREGIEIFVSMWENIPLFETQKRLAKNVQEDSPFIKRTGIFKFFSSSHHEG